MTANPTRSIHAFLKSVVLVLVACGFLMGTSRAQDFEAIERRLGLAVADGEVSLEQASVMLNALREHEQPHEEEVYRRIEAWVSDVGSSIKAAVEEGDVSEEEAWEKWRHFKQNDLMPKLHSAMKEGMLSRGAYRKLILGIGESEIGARLRAAVNRGDLTEAEAKAKWRAWTKQHGEPDRRERLLDQFSSLGISPEGIGRIKRALMEKGVEKEQLERTLVSLLLITDRMKDSDGEWEWNDRMKTHLREQIGLDEAQIELLKAMAIRLEAGKNDRHAEQEEGADGDASHEEPAESHGDEGAVREES